MASDWVQLTIVILVVAASAVYVGRTLWKSWAAKSGGGCPGGCGCETANASKSATGTK